MIATPGRLQQLLTVLPALRTRLKTLEVLILDEADRFSDTSFKQSLTCLLPALPKQRRTGLFSATQTKHVEDMAVFGLRNPVRITIDGEECNVLANEADGANTVVPASLENEIAVVAASAKLSCLIDLLLGHSQSKVLVFVCSSHVVEYLSHLLPHFLSSPSCKAKSTVIAMHGKKKSRDRRLAQFRRVSHAVMLCTDVMSRGIDLPDVDLVIQFDIPKLSSWYVHRSGRAGRQGRHGRAVLLLSEEQAPYADMLNSYETVALRRIEMPVDADRVETVRRAIVQLAAKDRALLESGTRAFVSFIQSYTKHDCQVVCPLRDLDVVGYAHCYGLLRLPRMPEFIGKDLSAFKRSDVDTAGIAFTDKKREKMRLQRREEIRTQRHDEVGEESKEIETVEWVHPKVARKRKRREASAARKEWDELADDINLLKKMKKGRLSAKEKRQL